MRFSGLNDSFSLSAQISAGLAGVCILHPGLASVAIEIHPLLSPPRTVPPQFGGSLTGRKCQSQAETKKKASPPGACSQQRLLVNDKRICLQCRSGSRRGWLVVRLN